MVRLGNVRLTNRSETKPANLTFTLAITDTDGTQLVVEEPYFSRFWKPQPDIQEKYLPNPAHVPPGGTRKGDLGFVPWKNQRRPDPKDPATRFELRVKDYQTEQEQSYPFELAGAEPD